MTLCCVFNFEDTQYVVVKVKCAYCDFKDTRVIDKRESKDLRLTRRRRECLKCARRFTTYEKAELSDFYIIKKDGKREKFDREKLERGVKRAFEKRPIAHEEVKKMIDNVETNLRKRGKEVKSSIAGELLMKRIEKLDKIAYVRFASVYKDFKDVKDFKEEIKKL